LGDDVFVVNGAALQLKP